MANRFPIPDLKYQSLCLGNTDGLPEYFNWLASSWNVVYDRNSPKLDFGLYSLWGLRTFRSWAHRECKDSALFWSQALYASFFARIAYFASWFHEGATFHPGRWSYNFHYASAVYSRSFRIKDDTFYKGLPYIYVHQSIPHSAVGSLFQHVCVGPIVFSRRNLQTTRWWSADSFAPNVQHNNKSCETAEVDERLLTERISSLEERCLQCTVRCCCNRSQRSLWGTQMRSSTRPFAQWNLILAHLKFATS